MGRVKLLAEDTVKKIAAGEVIARPSSVVKELIENSIDAQSSIIKIEVKDGGKDLIRVSDDGWGMDRDDARLAVSRHATSKLSSIDDLLSLKTLGFRGEALASIAEVSRLKIETNNDARFTGTLLVVNSGEIKEIKEISRTQGTTITVETLFFNLPVRRGFLKSGNYELKSIIETVKSYATAYPEISFILFADGKEVLNLPKTNSVKERLEFFLDKNGVNSLKAVNIEHPIISLTGFLQNPFETQAISSLQLVYFNHRPVRSRTVVRAIYEGYANSLRGNNPNFVLFFDTSPERLDVNIHPTKQEVRFQDERFLFDFVREAVIQTLGIVKESAGGGLIGDSSLPTKELFSQGQLPQGFWQLHNTFIFAQIQSGYCVIDQHIASERIIFEEILTGAKAQAPKLQNLLFPIIIELKPEDFIIFSEIRETLTSLGIQAKPFSGRTIAIEAIPAGSYLTKDDIQELFLDLSKLEKKDLGVKEEIAKVVACKSAVKAGQRLSQAEMEFLINRLFACANPFFCPHGRPIIIKVTLEDLSRRFLR